MGMGFAATRDIVSFLRRDAADATGTPNPVAGRIDHAVSMGVSQSGRFLHDFLYLGFNEDEAGRMVFDGLMPHVAAGKKMFTNYRFAQPGRNMQEHGETLYPGTAFPFSYPVTTDAVTGRTDGWLARCLAAKNCPKIIQTDTDLEFYQSFGSLVATDTKGEPLAMPDNVRLYYLASLAARLARRTPSRAWSRSAPTRPIRSMPGRCCGRWSLRSKDGRPTAPAAGEPLSEPRRRHAGDGRRERQELPDRFRASSTAAWCTSRPWSTTTPCRRPRRPPIRYSCRKVDADGNAVAGVRLPTLVGAGRDPSRLERAQGRASARRAVRQFRLDAAVRQDARGTHQGQRSAAVARGALSECRRARGHHRERRRGNWCRTGCCWRTTSAATCRRRTRRHACPE